jgi:hypothetical protein
LARNLFDKAQVTKDQQRATRHCDPTLVSLRSLKALEYGLLKAVLGEQEELGPVGESAPFLIIRRAL